MAMQQAWEDVRSARARRADRAARARNRGARRSSAAHPGRAGSGAARALARAGHRELTRLRRRRTTRSGPFSCGGATRWWTSAAIAAPASRSLPDRTVRIAVDIGRVLRSYILGIVTDGCVEKYTLAARIVFEIRCYTLPGGRHFPARALRIRNILLQGQLLRRVRVSYELLIWRLSCGIDESGYS